MAHLKKNLFRAAFLCNYESTIVNQAMLFVNKLSCLKPFRLLSRTIVHPLNHSNENSGICYAIPSQA